jgi:hypothetical protein
MNISSTATQSVNMKRDNILLLNKSATPSQPDPCWRRNDSANMMLDIVVLQQNGIGMTHLSSLGISTTSCICISKWLITCTRSVRMTASGHDYQLVMSGAGTCIHPLVCQYVSVAWQAALRHVSMA